ncbi:MAG: metallophosphatase family protein [Gammaproteobacteria bacterium]|nr:metallophosphatase family protein [Gammaproteobacteria bacterium]
MMTKIGILSDIHATPAPVAEALAIFKKQNVSLVLCAGDIAGYGSGLEETIELLIENNCQSISGNHDEWYLRDSTDAENSANKYLSELPSVREFYMENKNIYMVHASPPDSSLDGMKMLDENGHILSAEKSYWTQQLADFKPEVLIVGHTHQVFAENIGNTFVINPGSTCFNHSCVILELPSLSVSIFPLSGKSIHKTWNWGMYYSKGKS